MPENGTNVSTTLKPADWFVSPPIPPEQYPPTSSAQWPWIRLTLEQYQYLYYRARFPESPILYWSRMTAYPALLLCLVGSILTLCTTILGKKREKSSSASSSSSFYAVMIAIACLDAIFMIMISIRNIFYLWPSVGGGGAALFRWAAIILSGPSYACSLMSDALTLCLSIERCLAIEFAIFYKNLASQSNKKRLAWSAALIFAVGLASTRFHYSLEKYDSTFSLITWFAWVSYFSDVIVPISMTFLMIPIVAVIVAGLRNRQKFALKQKQKQQQPQTQMYDQQKNQNQQQRQSMKMISLLISLLIMYFLNQLGYTLYCVADFNYQPQLASLNYGSSYDQVKLFADAHFFVAATHAYSIVAEYFARSMVFYCYMAFSRKFRTDVHNLFRTDTNLIAAEVSKNMRTVSVSATPKPSVRTVWVEN